MLALVALALASGVTGCGRARKDRPFTRAGVLAELGDRYPGASLPPDEAVPGVDSRLDLRYARRDGRDLLLDVFMPTGAGPYPGVIVVHGGAWKSGDRAMERPLARQLAARGFVTATVGYRLGPDGRFPNALFDLKAAVRWLRSNAGAYRLSAARIGAVGASAGGQLVALAGATNGDPAYEDAAAQAAAGSESVTSDLAAVVDIDGLADFTGADLRREGEPRGGRTDAVSRRRVRRPSGDVAGGLGAFSRRPQQRADVVHQQHRSVTDLARPDRDARSPARARHRFRDRRVPGNAASVLAGQPLVHPDGRRGRALPAPPSVIGD